jgi:hypothetical protein
MQTPTGVIFVPREASITEADAGDLMSLLQGKAKVDGRLNRWYPIIGIEQITDSSEEPVTGNLAATGYSEKLRDGAAIYLFEYPAKICRAKTIKQFDSWSEGVYVITSDKKLWGRVMKDGSLAPYIPLSTAVYGGGFNDGQNIITSKLQINFGAQGDFLKYAGFFGFDDDDDISGIVGLQTVDIVPNGAKKYKVVTKCDRANLYDLFGATLAGVTLWKVTTASTGAAVSVTAVAGSATTKDYTLTFTAPSEKYYVSLAEPSVLAAAGVVGYESDRLTVTP